MDIVVAGFGKDMPGKALLLVASAAILTVTLLSGCDSLFPSSLATANGCVLSFMDDLDTQPSLIPNELYPGAKDYAAAAERDFWIASGFSADETFALVGQAVSGDAVTATLISTRTYSQGVPIVFKLVRLTDGNYAIASISVNGATVFD